MSKPTTPHHPLILGIESSCDDTACALVDGSGRVLASVVSSQLAHQPYGGVVPEIASREHLKNWPAVSREALRLAGVEIDAVDVVAATRGPGLVGSLLVGLSVGRAIAFGLDLPFYGMHHLEGHLYSPFLEPDGQPSTAIPEHFEGLVVSGGHTSLLDVRGGAINSLVETRDDAMGEVFDKVGKRLGLAFPQGPKVDQLAESGDPERFRLSVPKVKEELFFSYSGLKSQALREIEQLERQGELDSEEIRQGATPPQPALDLLAGFRRATVDQIIDRLARHHATRPIGTLAVSGGVAANRLLRRELSDWAARNTIDLRLVPLTYSGDNAAMIAFAALEQQRRGVAGNLHDVEVASRIPFRSVS
ncbi:MAG: tRNA (adenosine(37)-N6)-threonylcarbamoyltransferase complex transferase subunit TsaD [Acidobacteriota bacterium]